MHVLPATKFTFNNNSALQFGGAVGVENVRGSDDTVVLTNFCFIQYNIGSENEYNPQEWKVRICLLEFPEALWYYIFYRYTSLFKIIQW